MISTDTFDCVKNTLGKGVFDTFKTPLTPESICRHYKALPDVCNVMRQKVFCDTFQTHFMRFCIANNITIGVLVIGGCWT